MVNERDDNAHRDRKPFDVRVVESAELLAGGRSVMIRHDDEMYRLTVTRNGKLILQK